MAYVKNDGWHCGVCNKLCPTKMDAEDCECKNELIETEDKIPLSTNEYVRKRILELFYEHCSEKEEPDLDAFKQELDEILKLVTITARDDA